MLIMASIIRDQGLDKFYTREPIAKLCINSLNELIPLNDFYLVIEPSAGNGSFLKNIDHLNKIGIDISPDDESIIKMNFFDYAPQSTSQNILVIGNPPFGKNSSLAVRFFNHAAKWANTIAFIIPKTFRKVSIQNRLNMNFHLINDMDIPDKPCSFVPTMNVKCCFQIWQRSNVVRNTIIYPDTHPDWIFLKYGPKDENNQPTPPIGADFAIRAYGGKCGYIQTTDLHTLRPKSWHFIKSNIDSSVLIERLTNLDYSGSVNTARQNSIGKKELVQLYITWINREQ